MSRNKGRKYGSAADRAKKAAAQAGPSGGGGTMFKGIPSGTEFYNPEEGKVTLRLLPYIVTDPKHPDGELAPVDDIWYKRPFKRFRGIGTEKKAYISPKSIGKPCPILEYYAAAKADPSIPEKEANKARPQDCVLYNVQVIDRKGNVSDPMLWWYSYHLFEKQLKKELLDPDNEDFLTFMDLEGGFDIRVRWEKESFQGNDFLSAGNISFIERDDIDEEILDQVVDLDNILNVMPYEELNRIFLELDEDGDGGGSDDGEQEQKSSGRRGRQEKEEKEEKSSRRRGRQEEKEEEKPPTSSRRRKSAEPEKSKEDDEEKPKSSRRGRRQQEEEKPKEDEASCPNGLTWGDDWDTKKVCEDCPKFDACAEKFEADEKAKKKEEKSNKKKEEKKESSKGGGGGECPFGFIFGKDCDTKDECNECEKWDDCMDRQEEMEGK